MSRPCHLMDQIRQDRLERDRRDAEKARRKAEYEALPKQRQKLMLTKMDDLPDQRTMWEEP